MLSLTQKPTAADQMDLDTMDIVKCCSDKEETKFQKSVSGSVSLSICTKESTPEQKLESGALDLEFNFFRAAAPEDLQTQMEHRIIKWLAFHGVKPVDVPAYIAEV